MLVLHVVVFYCYSCYSFCIYQDIVKGFHECPFAVKIGHVLNEQGAEYRYLKSIELKNRARHLREHPNIRKFTKSESYSG